MRRAAIILGVVVALGGLTALLVSLINDDLTGTGFAASLNGSVLRIASSDPDVVAFTFSATGSDPAVTQLMLPTTASGNRLIPGTGDVPVDFQVTADATFSISLNGGAATDVTLLAVDTQGMAAVADDPMTPEDESMPAVPANASMQDLVDDLNAALADASLDDDVVFESTGSTLTLRSKKGSITSLQVTTTGGDTARTELKLPASETVTFSNIDGTAEPAKYQLTGDATFQLQVRANSLLETFDITLAAADTEGNTSFADLLADLNAAMAGSDIEANEGDPDVIELGPASVNVEAFEVDISGASNPASTQLMLVEGVVSGDFVLTAPQTTPVDGKLDGDELLVLRSFEKIIVDAASTVGNATSTDLRDDIRSALQNSLLPGFDATLDGSKLVLRGPAFSIALMIAKALTKSVSKRTSIGVMEKRLNALVSR